jgi:hypothetical protein
MAPRQIKMPVKDNTDKEPEEVFSQRKRPESGRYLLQVAPQQAARSFDHLVGRDE